MSVTETLLLTTYHVTVLLAPIVVVLDVTAVQLFASSVSKAFVPVL